MSCPETKKSLSDYLDDRLGPEVAEEVSAHLADCPSCRAELAELRRIDALLGDFADPPVDEARLDSLWSRVEAQLDVPEEASVPGAAALGAAPILVSPRPAAQPRWLVPTLAVVGVATIAVTVFAVILLVRSPHREQRQSKVASRDSDMGAMTTGRSTGMVGMDAVDAMGSDAMSTMDAMGSDGMDAMDAMDAMDDGMDAMDDGMDAMDDGADAMGSDAMSTTSRRRRRRRGGSSAGRSMSSGSSRSMSAGSSMSSGSTMSSGSSSLQDLLRRAGGMSSSGSGSSGASNIPKRLSMGKIRAAVGRILGSARACGTRYKVPGTCRVRVVVKGSTGRVSSASVLGSFRGTPTGRCVVRAFRRARFSRFQNSSQSFIFPLIFR